MDRKGQVATPPSSPWSTPSNTSQNNKKISIYYGRWPHTRGQENSIFLFWKNSWINKLLISPLIFHTACTIPPVLNISIIRVACLYLRVWSAEESACLVTGANLVRDLISHVGRKVTELARSGPFALFGRGRDLLISGGLG